MKEVSVNIKSQLNNSYTILLQHIRHVGSILADWRVSPAIGG